MFLKINVVDDHVLDFKPHLRLDLKFDLKFDLRLKLSSILYSFIRSIHYPLSIGNKDRMHNYKVDLVLS